MSERIGNIIGEVLEFEPQPDGTRIIKKMRVECIVMDCSITEADVTPDKNEPPFNTEYRGMGFGGGKIPRR